MKRRPTPVHKNAGSLEEDILFKKLHVTKSSKRKRKANPIQHMGKCKSSRKNDLASSSTSEEVGAGTSNERSSPNKAVMPVDRDANEYNMQHQNRGRAVIFNHDKFDKRCKSRKGSKHDIKHLKMKFSSLGFIVTVKNNCTLSQIKHIISKLAKEDYSNDDCLVVIVLTHGNVVGDLIPREGNISYGVEVLWEPLTSDKCPTLAGKPKLFFIQACRGSKVDVGTELNKSQSDEIDSNTSSYSIPTHADFLIAHSTVGTLPAINLKITIDACKDRKVHAGTRDEIDLAPPSCSIPRYPDFLTVYSNTEDFPSYRDTNCGSWFIQSLCNELNMTDSLMQILINTTRRITPFSPGNLIQVPSSISTLTKNIYFHPKDSNNM